MRFALRVAICRACDVAVFSPRCARARALSLMKSVVGLPVAPVDLGTVARHGRGRDTATAYFRGERIPARAPHDVSRCSAMQRRTSSGRVAIPSETGSHSAAPAGPPGVGGHAIRIAAATAPGPLRPTPAIPLEVDWLQTAVHGGAATTGQETIARPQPGAAPATGSRLQMDEARAAAAPARARAHRGGQPPGAASSPPRRHADEADRPRASRAHCCSVSRLRHQ